MTWKEILATGAIDVIPALLFLGLVAWKFP